MAFDLFTIQSQLMLAILLALFWAAIYEASVPRINRHVKQASWWPRAMRQVKSMMHGFGYPKSATPTFKDGTSDEMASEFFSWVVVTCIQHIISCLMILPVLCLGWEHGGHMGHAALILGTLNDVGFDVYDSVKKVLTMPLLRQRFCFLECISHTACPEKFCFVTVVLHHVLAMSIVLPMNIYYPHVAWYHVICAALLGAAGLCYLLVVYKFTIDATCRKGLLVCKGVAVLQFIVVGYTRGLLWFSQAWTAIWYFRSQGDVAFFVAGCACGFLMSVFNVLLLLDATKSLVKWMPKQCSKETEKTAHSAARHDTGLVAAEVVAEQARLSAPLVCKDRMMVCTGRRVRRC